MKVRSHLLIATLFLIGLGAANVRADDIAACQAGPVSNIVGTSCTIGDKTFTFQGFTSDVYAGNDVFFNPATGSSGDPGFTLEPLFARGTVPSFSVVGDSNGAEQTDELYYAVSITDPTSGAEITGSTATITNASATPTDPTDDILKAVASNDLAIGSCVVNPEAYLEVSNGTTVFDRPSTTESCPGATAAYGIAEVYLFAQNGSVSLQSGGFYVDELNASTTATPEPGTLAMFAVGLAALLAYRKRVDSRANTREVRLC